jgi:hypothetical protein
MQTNESTTDINMVEDFQNLQMLIFDDVSGTNTRLMADYFQEASEKSGELLAAAQKKEEKELAFEVQNAFDAARRIVLKTWERCHGAELVA